MVRGMRRIFEADYRSFSSVFTKSSIVEKVSFIVLIALGLIGILSLLLFILGILGMNSRPLVRAEHFIEALGDEQTFAFAYDATSEQFQEWATEAELQQFIAGHAIFSRIDTIEFSRRGRLDEGEYLVGVIQSRDGYRQPFYIEMIKENGFWQVLYFSLEIEDVPLEDLYELDIESLPPIIESVNESVEEFLDIDVILDGAEGAVEEVQDILSE